MAQPESRLSRAIMAHLRANGIWCMKIHGGPTMMAGAPDILACVPVQPVVEFQGIEIMADYHVGLFIGFETKMPNGGNPTPVQEHVHGRIRVAAGRVFVPRSVHDVTEALRSVGWSLDRPVPPIASAGN
jgi:hypothetical protein